MLPLGEEKILLLGGCGYILNVPTMKWEVAVKENKIDFLPKSDEYRVVSKDHRVVVNASLIT